MLKFIYKFLFWLADKNFILYNKYKLIIIKFIQFYIPWYYKISKKEYGLNTCVKRRNKIIISLTTIPSRVKTLPLCIESLLRQTMKPDKIILWISKEEFESFNFVNELLQQKNRGLEICYCDDDLKSHKKYYYTMKKYPNDIIITVDDDVYYPEDLVENLMKQYKKEESKNCVICYTAIEITFKNNTQVDKYINWKQISPNTHNPSYLLLAVGIGGILYPPNCLNKDVFDKEKINTLSLYASDLWLKVMELLNNTKVKTVDKYSRMWIDIPDTQREALWKYNIVRHKNDKQLKLLLNEYNISLKYYSKLNK